MVCGTTRIATDPYLYLERFITYKVSNSVYTFYIEGDDVGLSGCRTRV